MHAENTRFFEYYVRILALELEENQIGYGTLCMSYHISFTPIPFCIQF